MRFNSSRWTTLTVLALTPAALAAVPLRTVALAGQQAEGTSVAFAAVRTPVIDGTGLTAFVAELTGDGVDETNSVGMYSEGAGFLHLWARNGTPNGADIAEFVELLTSAGPPGAALCACDMNRDGLVDTADKLLFINRVLGL